MTFGATIRQGPVTSSARPPGQVTPVVVVCGHADRSHGKGSPVFSIAEVVREQAAIRPDAPAVSGQGRSATFADIDRRSNRVAQALAALGVARGDRVAYVGLNRTDVWDIVT